MIDYLSQFDLGTAFFGGVLIGLAATILLWGLGRVAGISGITFTLLDKNVPDKAWRVLFIIGLVTGTALVHFALDLPVPPPPASNTLLVIAAGLITGFGTQLGSGCTSGHGVCGISRLSIRSVVATMTFMAAGFITVYVVRHLLGAI
jgi:uncharacterized membrane protein YedE/YeeE